MKVNSKNLWRAPTINNRNIYLSIIIIGVVFSLLSLLTGMGDESFLTFLFFTFYLVAFLRLIEEWRFFHNYDAPPASSLFIILMI
ncbi:MAG: hypothetical protein ACFFD1_14365, partial [Candidatus Thorarchaeota archaeon]